MIERRSRVEEERIVVEVVQVRRALERRDEHPVEREGQEQGERRHHEQVGDPQRERAAGAPHVTTVRRATRSIT